MGVRLWIGILAAGALFLVYGLGGGAGVGVSVSSIAGASTFEASSSAAGLLGAVLTGIAYTISLTLPAAGTTGQLAGTGRRATAWFIDFLLSFTALAAILTLVPLTREAIATGHFEWQFQRSNVTIGDWAVSFVEIVLAFVGMAFYWAIPVLREGQTIGQGIVGVRVMSVGVDAPSLSRVWVRGLVQPFAGLLWLGKVVTGKYWHDEFAKTKVVRVLDRVPAAA